MSWNTHQITKLKFHSTSTSFVSVRTTRIGSSAESAVTLIRKFVNRFCFTKHQQVCMYDRPVRIMAAEAAKWKIASYHDLLSV